MKKFEELETRYLNPLTDFGFHRIFGEESNKDLLMDFLNEIIKEEGRITDIQYLVSEQWGNFETEEDMERYNKSILEYHDVRGAVDLALEEALEEEKNAIIQKSLQMNIPIEVIIELTGYSKEQIIHYKVNGTL